MSVLTVAVVPVGEDRFGLVLSDPTAAPSQGPAVGDDPQGYTEDELRRVLRDRYELSGADIATLITIAEAKRAHGG